jgi:hypothetical protein
VARVQSDDIAASSVARVAAAQQKSPREARDILVRDALYAAGARERGLEAGLAFPASGVLARRLLKELLAQAERAGPVTDEELAKATRVYWLSIDRPEGFATAHAYVLLGPDDGPDRRAEALRWAEALREKALDLAAQVTGSSPRKSEGFSPQPPDDPITAALRDLAANNDGDGVEAKVEAVPAMAADGRELSSEATQNDLDYARAASALTARGDVSPVTTTRFGVHVIVLLDRTPAVRFSTEERRAKVRDTVIKDRALELQKRLMKELRPTASIDPNVDSVLAEVQVDPTVAADGQAASAPER